MQSINDPASARDAARGAKPEADTNGFRNFGIVAILAVIAIVAFYWS